MALHWLVALLVLFMGGFVLAETPNTDPTKISALRDHMVLGVTIFILTLIRLVWRRISALRNHAER